MTTTKKTTWVPKRRGERMGKGNWGDAARGREGWRHREEGKMEKGKKRRENS